MNDATIKRLNAINREFYRVTAESFDESRSQSWPGWEPILPQLRPPVSVLDVGCGNGRFGLFLAEHVAVDQIIYHGIDNNPALLESARAALQYINAQVMQHDIIEQPIAGVEQVDLVAMFGVLHHIPGAQQRRDFMRQLASYVKPGGLLVFAAWRFFEYERFRSRIVPWPDDLDVEPHDYLLDWRRGKHALRYCHFVDDTEHAELVAATHLEEIQTYRADGRTNDINRYSILRRAQS